jgi:aminopeptidase N
LKLEISLDFDKKSVQGKSTLTLASLIDGLMRVDLDAVEMDIRAVRDSSGRDLSYDYTGDKLLIYLNSPLAENDNLTITIDYSATPRRGLYFVGPDEGYPHKPVQVYSHGEEMNNSYWFPCYDFPNDRMTSEVIVTVPNKFTAISNGKLVGVSEDNGTRTRTYHWIQKVPHVTYLVSIAVGEFLELRDEWEGIPVFYYVDKRREKDAMRSFQKTPKMIEFYSKIFGLRYPYAKYSQVAVADFVTGAQENISATTATDEILHDERAHLDYSCDHLVAHELAHQWFGDLITCKDWSHIWLNEAFATYFEFLFLEHDSGHNEHDAHMIEYYDRYMDEVKERYRRPMVTRTYHEPAELFDRHTYEKGSFVMRTLRYTLGDNQFWKAIQAYVKKYCDGVVETSDFKSTIEEVTGQSMDLFFGQWLYKPGHPELSIKLDWDEKRRNLALTIDQTQDTSNGTPVFQFPAEIHIVDEHGDAKHTVNLSQRSHTFDFSLERKPLSVVFDPEHWILKTIRFDKPQGMLLYELKNGKSNWTRLWAVQALTKFVNMEVIQALQEAILHDQSWIVQAEAAKSLGAIGTEAALDALLETVNVKHPKARRGVVRALGEFRSELAAETLLTALTRDESYYVEAESARSLGKTKSVKAFDALVNAFRTKKSYRDIIKSYALEGLTELKDIRAIPVILEGTKYGLNFRVRETAAKMLGKVGGSNQMAFERLIELLRDKNLHIRIAAASALRDLHDPRALPELERTLQADVEPDVRKAVRRTIFVIRDFHEKGAEWGKMQGQIEELRQENRSLLQRIDMLEKQVSKS